MGAGDERKLSARLMMGEGEERGIFQTGARVRLGAYPQWSPDEVMRPPSSWLPLKVNAPSPSLP